MPPFDFDHDLSNSDLTIGIELEYPGRNSTDEKYVTRGRDTCGLQQRYTHPPFISGHGTYDGTVGLEVVSDRLDLEDAANWHAEVVDYVEDEYNVEYQPVGLMENGNTAGMHIHISHLTEQQARDLYEISQTPWAKVLFCSSIANENGEAAWPVFRGGRHCRMQFGGSRYACINHRSSGHYEWRMPEPVDSDHVEIIARFLRLFEQEADLAIEYAQEVLDDGDDRITSIKRAESTGMDIEDIPSISREPVSDSEEFFQTMIDSWALPEIYQVELGGEHFYRFESEMDAELEVEGIEFETNDVLHADTLEVANQELAEDVSRAFQRRHNESSRETDATKELKKIVKKKKS